ncbi:hypothetical protein BDQ12DRAFT_762080 [Crucibulum laeve]|uniref:NAD(P)-binding protein n=1 Tax=Crucibulum laeve TaxID=68775 RepID=A0A5C3MB96_9AGAR|nr:hypothetical protein BDQ12DRAFT_762080 [Crucibulum laeve]
MWRESNRDFTVPMDTEERYLKEPDAAEWKSHLRIIGAEFRTAKDMFSLVETVLQCLEAWDTKKLDILINNAAQTLTDSLSKEEDGIRRESLLLHGAASKNADGGLVIDNAYAPQVRGGQVGHYLETSSRVAQRLIKNENTDSPVLSPKESELSSWAQTISSVSYEDVISAHSVNTFVPFILLRELLPWMRRPKLSADVTATNTGVVKPYSYVINVSSREGLPEDEPNHSAKAGHHVHTNMSKAALNMLTETEAGPAWHSGKVAINSVDPGYMSADSMWMKMVGREGQACPIGWEDGVGRVLWVVAKGEIEGTPIWGRFLKHFGEIRSGR